MSQLKIIARGAEAIILKDKNKIIKHRIKKSYRIKELDEKIRKLRTRSETKLLEKAGKLIPIPNIISSDEKTKKLIIEFINGKKLSEHLNNFSLKKQKQICKQIGKNIAQLHNKDIIHGDLTTSNMILVEDKKNLPAHSRSQINQISINKKSSTLTKKQADLINNFVQIGVGGGEFIKPENEPIIFFIDFGLGFISGKYEDKAVDLHLLKQALEAKHFTHWEDLVKKVFEGYKTNKSSKTVLERLKAVEKRGRYKH